MGSENGSFERLKDLEERANFLTTIAQADSLFTTSSPRDLKIPPVNAASRISRSHSPLINSHDAVQLLFNVCG